MKHTLVLAFSLASLAIASPLASGAESGDKPARKRPALTEEQKKLRKEMVDKYDTNKDGKLDKDERSKITREDQAKLDQAGIGGRRKAPSKTEKETAPKSGT